MKTIGKWILLLTVLSCFLLGLSSLDRSHREEDRRLLEESLRRGAVACYAAEGFYPPDSDYLCRNYGITYDEARYAVHYVIFASNLMPDITVTERAP